MSHWCRYFYILTMKSWSQNSSINSKSLIRFHYRSLRIGNLSNPIDHIVENVRAAAHNVFQYCPGGLCNIHSISLQMVTGGPSLPLYIDAGLFFSDFLFLYFVLIRVKNVCWIVNCSGIDIQKSYEMLKSLWSLQFLLQRFLLLWFILSCIILIVTARLNSPCQFDEKV